ncbi:hypothetical protein BCR34DRAFT_289810 [Clohesyomyces aquaticus]|uniref:Mid2 domain-containing protein n=1 Tax=Clohesyomyces aquaticus TaxID=1231657 RepID=A0A1Y1ZQT7_9PLEO|nr:hypothetical protein BCR34DRAFT_289810 [Clohesyomyces aquaticus]
MSYSGILISALALLPAANCVAFGGPAPTEATRALTGMSPVPTKGPSIVELKKRVLGSETCGFYSNDMDLPVTCGIGRTCIMYSSSSIGAVGCCDGSDFQKCGWATKCVDYDAVTAGSCGSACKSNTFIRKCTDALSPFCVTWTYPGDGVKDFGCTSDILSTYETIFFDATDTIFSSSTSLSLSTLSGNAVTGWGGAAAASSAGGNGATDTSVDSSSPTSPAGNNYGGGGSKTEKKKGVSIGLIAGVAIGALIIFAAIAGLIIFCCLKQKKKKALAANTAAIAAAQASRPQSQYNPAMQQQQMNQMQPPMPQTPQPANGEYFKPAQPMAQPMSPQPNYQQTQAEPQKFNYQQNVHEQPVVSNPPTPAPPYVQPYYAGPNGGQVPPMPSQSPAPMTPAGQYQQPQGGAHEVDAISMPVAPGQQAQGQPGQPVQHQPVYEIGGGR